MLKFQAFADYYRILKVDEDSSSQCNHCKFMFDFYKCVRCHGDDCYVKNGVKDAIMIIVGGNHYERMCFLRTIYTK